MHVYIYVNICVCLYPCIYIYIGIHVLEYMYSCDSKEHFTNVMDIKSFLKVLSIFRQKTIRHQN